MHSQASRRRGPGGGGGDGEMDVSRDAAMLLQC